MAELTEERSYQKFLSYLLACGRRLSLKAPSQVLDRDLRELEKLILELKEEAEAASSAKTKRRPETTSAPKIEEEKNRMAEIKGMARERASIKDRGDRRQDESDEERLTVHLANIVRVGETMVIPESLTYNEAIQVLQRQRDYEEEETGIRAEIECFLFEGAWAFHRACSQLFGWVQNIPTPGFFGPEPPQMIGVPISRKEVVQVPWGRIRLPVIEGYLETSVTKKEGRFIFVITGEVKRRYEGTVQRLIEETKRLVREESIYRGKAFRVRFRDSDGDPLPVPQPEFLNLEHAPTPEDLIFNRAVFNQIDANIFIPIARTEDVRRAGVPLKRGILLSGKYGTGKTLTAAATARLAEEHGWTFIECERADEIGQVLRVAQLAGRAVVFCEDIDQVMSNERDINMNAILNIIDGVEAKSTEVIIVLSTNAVKEIQKAMIRPGRIDAVIQMEPPDTEAVERLLRMYGRGLIAEETKLERISQRLTGQIPSMVRDVVEAAKLYQIRYTQPGETIRVTEEALLDAAVSKEMQIALLAEPVEDKRTPIEKAAVTLAEAIQSAPEDEHGNGKALTGVLAGTLVGAKAAGTGLTNSGSGGPGIRRE